LTEEVAVRHKVGDKTEISAKTQHRQKTRPKFNKRRKTGKGKT